MAEDPQPLTLQQRIAALNAAHIGRVPGEPPFPMSRPKPSIPEHRPATVRHTSVNIPHEQINGTVTQMKVGNQPNGPPPLPTRRQPPPLPTRTSSEESSRRASTTSPISTTSINGNNGTLALRKKSEDNGPRIKAPAWGACELPPLPTKQPPATSRPNVPQRPKYTSRASQQSIASQTSVSTQASVGKPTLPPPLPTRKASVDNYAVAPEPVARKMPPLPSQTAIQQAKKAAFNIATIEAEPEPVPTKPLVASHTSVATSHTVTQPPPVPHSSRPDISTLQATKPRPVTTSAITKSIQSVAPSSSTCLTCRDFSIPDHHASLYPRHQVSSLQNLALQLTSQFPSPTDKARAIFTWLHYNISYDVVSFFSGNVRGSTPQSTLQSGLAVCEGYAALFANLATYAGLEAVVISGHGKGFGHSNLVPGQPVPPYEAGHAWNAVKIDNGEWKLVDPCWGAGHVQGAGMPYVQSFHSHEFTMSNEQFGTKHFPSNKNQFFLPGGRTLSWDEYIRINPDSWPDHCEPPTVFTNAKEDHSIGEKTVLPRDRKIHINRQNIVRFQFGLLCPHWTLENHTKKGPPPLFLLGTHGVDGRTEDQIPLEYIKGTTPGGGGDLWYLDMSARELGAPGQTLTLFAVATFGPRQNCRGLSVQEFRQGKGRVGMSFVGIAAWDLV